MKSRATRTMIRRRQHCRLRKELHHGVELNAYSRARSRPRPELLCISEPANGAPLSAAVVLRPAREPRSRPGANVYRATVLWNEHRGSTDVATEGATDIASADGSRSAAAEDRTDAVSWRPGRCSPGRLPRTWPRRDKAID